MLKKKLQVNAAMLLGFFSFSILLVLPLRVYQYLKIIEPGTGFYKQTDFSVPVLYGLLVFFGGGMLLISFINRRQIALSTTVRKSPGLGIVALLTAVALLVDAVVMYRHFTSLYYGTAQNNGGELFFESATSGIMKSGALPMLFESVFAVFSAIFFIVLGVAYISGKSNGSEFKLLAIAPLAWSVCRILHRFMRTISFMNVSDLFFELLMIVFLMIFFMAFAQLISRVNHKGVDWKLTGFGLPAALLCLLCFVPRAAILVMGKGNLLTDLSPPEYCDLAVAVFILAFILDKVRFMKREEI